MISSYIVKLIYKIRLEIKDPLLLRMAHFLLIPMIWRCWRRRGIVCRGMGGMGGRQRRGRVGFGRKCRNWKDSLAFFRLLYWRNCKDKKRLSIKCSSKYYQNSKNKTKRLNKIHNNCTLSHLSPNKDKASIPPKQDK